MAKSALITHSVTEQDAGIRLDRWFARHHKGVPHALLEKYLRKGLIRVDKKKARSADRLEIGQSITVPATMLSSTPAVFPKATNMPKPADIARLQKCVLYKDADILILNKPAGLAVQGGSGQTQHVDAMLDGLRFDAAERPRLVHRLDKDTSGVLVLARHARAAAELAKRFAGRDIEKTYLALVIGAPLPRTGIIRLPLAKRARGGEYEAVGVEEGGSPAETEYKTLESLGGRLSWMELHPITGRTHQLRVHMAALGHPIVGDGKYGGRDAFIRGIDLPKQLHLHAAHIRIPGWHGRVIEARAPLPPHMQESRKSLGLDA